MKYSILLGVSIFLLSTICQMYFSKIELSFLESLMFSVPATIMSIILTKDLNKRN